jgi:hypothetical protein
MSAPEMPTIRVRFTDDGPEEFCTVTLYERFVEDRKQLAADADTLRAERDALAARVGRLEALTGRYINMVAFMEGTDFLDYTYPPEAFAPVTYGTSEYERLVAAVNLSDEETKALADLAIKARSAALSTDAQ